MPKAWGTLIVQRSWSSVEAVSGGSTLIFYNPPCTVAKGIKPILMKFTKFFMYWGIALLFSIVINLIDESSIGQVESIAQSIGFAFGTIIFSGIIAAIATHSSKEGFERVFLKVYIVLIAIVVLAKFV